VDRPTSKVMGGGSVSISILYRRIDGFENADYEKGINRENWYLIFAVTSGSASSH
jgi:hypothetical protein